mmetsp:Transcript_113944/g.322585  ORF Transcript_113944/g.322585 Transcript_113944/m.322585 type:complete len:336 (-) Transcript_113944:177-1184(-)
MDDARKLLDSLMGQTRDASLSEAKQNRGKNFTQDNVCKFYLLGFCPQHELQNSKLTTKRNLGDCHKVHSDAMKAEFEEHPDRAKYQAEYERMFLPFLEGQVREADAWVARERANAQKAEANSREKTTINTMPASVKEQLDQLNDDVNKMMAAAENLAEKGDIEGSKFKVVLAEEIKHKVKEIEAKHPSYTVTTKEEWVCDVCGTRTEAVTDANETRFAAHFKGKVHLGYAKIREWVKDLRQKQRDVEGKRGSSRDRGSREREADRRRRRSRSKDEKQGGGREEERKRRRSRSRDGNEKGGEHDRKRRRSRSRDGGRVEGSEGRRRRSRSRDRGRR